jgi:hypothetical protein
MGGGSGRADAGGLFEQPVRLRVLSLPMPVESGLDER